ncbi:hypothetical protein RHMOL_Rhmol08G0012500 [Rhododendron molle]|uniref:Uncharacterized protein n=1 Tax=Rhododendron molle TaxID=49168 RepID=A0ACC0MKI4_RHOML|nr:hypothetical protein RHMOL_Rhmol08G0012500 [Rhododendron molle]
MKKTSPLLYFLPLIIFVFSTFTTNPTKFLVAVDSAPNPVLDVEGNELRKGIDYYVLPVIRGNSGGLTLSSTSNATTACPLDVVQEQREVDYGLPLTFSPVNPKKGLIRVSTDTNIKFSVAIVCVRSTVWRLDGYDESVGKSFVTAGGIEGDPGRETISNWFRIDEYEGDYKLVFCPMVCNICKLAVEVSKTTYGNRLSR